MKTLTLPKKEYTRTRTKTTHLYQSAWDRLQRAGEKVRTHWKIKKSVEEILRDERRR